MSPVFKHALQPRVSHGVRFLHRDGKDLPDERAIIPMPPDARFTTWLLCGFSSDIDGVIITDCLFVVPSTIPNLSVIWSMECRLSLTKYLV